MKKLIYIIIIILLFKSNIVVSQVNESFTNIPTSTAGTYITRDWTGDDGFAWQATNARTDQTINGKAITIRGTSGHIINNGGVISGGCGTLSFNYKRVFTGNSTMQVFINGVQYGGDILVSSSTSTVYSETINVSGNIDIEIKNLTSGKRIVIDDLSWDAYTASSSPIISNITQTPIVVSPTDTVSISSDITDTDGIYSAELHWGTTMGGPYTNTITMSNSSGNTYTADSPIPSQSDGTTIYYEIYAVDNNANNSTSTEQNYTVSTACATDLIISEYVEGSSNNKYIEIFNGTGAAINMSNYAIKIYANGNSTASSTISLSNFSLTDGSVYIIAHSSANVWGGTPNQTSGSLGYNGDDAIALVNTSTSTTVDVIGQIGVDPGSQWGSGLTSTEDNTIIRKSSINSGDTNGSDSFDPAIEWDGFATDDVNHLGTHTMTCIPCTEPTTDAVFHLNSPQNLTTTSATLNWTIGDGENSIVVIREINSVSFIPSDNTTYTANSAFGLSADVGSNEFVVYNGNLGSVDITNLTPGTIYQTTIFEYNCSPGNEDYLTSGTPTTDVFITLPENPINFSPICISDNSIDLSWQTPTIGNFDGYLLVVREGAIPHSVNALDPNAALSENTNYNTAATYGGTAPNSRILYKGSSNSVTITGLTQDANYTFKLFAYATDGTLYEYSSGTTTNQTISFQNVLNPVAIANDGQVAVSWNNPDNSCFDEILVITNESNGISFSPSGDGTSYTPNTNYIAIDQPVFNSNGNNVTVTNLINGTTYYFEIFVRQGTTWSSGIEVNATPNSQTIFKPGDLVFVGYDNKVGTVDDVVTILTMVDILPNTTFWYSNATYEIGANANQRTEAWHSCITTPDANLGTQQFTYLGPDVLPKGSTFCITIDNDQILSADFNVHQSSGSGTYDFSNGLTPAGFATSLNISTSKPDSIFLMQGTWSSDLGGYRLFDGVVLGGIQDGGNWYTINDDLSAIASGSTDNRISRIPPEIECFAIQGTNSPGKGFAYYDDTKIGSQVSLLSKIGDFNANWVQGVGDNANDISGTSCDANFTFTISGAATAGAWTNAKGDNNWFNCGNWENLAVPDETTNVVINTIGGVDKAVIDDNAIYADAYEKIAKCNNLTINGEKVELIGDPNDVIEVYGDLTITNGVLNMDDLNDAVADGVLKIKGNWTNSLEGNFNEGNSTIIFNGTNQQDIDTNIGNDTEHFYNLTLDNLSGITFASHNIHAAGDLQIIQNTTPLTVTAQHYILAGNALKNDNNTHFIIQDKGSFVQTTNGADLNTGVNNTTFEVHKTTTPYVMYDYTYWSSPIENAQINTVFSANNTNYIYSFNTVNFNDKFNGNYPQNSGTADSYDDNGNDWQQESSTMTKGKGYIVMGEGATFPVTPPSLTTFTQSVVFENGKINNGIIPINVNLDEYNTTNGSGNSFNKNDNLVGNPYPSAISASQFLTTNSNLGGTIYLWTHDTAISSGISGPNLYNFTNDDYATWNSSGGTAAHVGKPAPTGNIASGQGFFVTATVAEQIHFNNDMRVLNENDNFYRPQNRIWLNLTNSNGLFRQILIGFFDDATDDEDRLYDGLRLENGTNWDFYSILNNKKMAIQGLSQFESEKTIPLGVEIIQAGIFDISIDHLEHELANVNVYLKDLLLNNIHNLKNSNYSVTINTLGNIDNRFELIFQRDALVVLNNEQKSKLTLYNIKNTNQIHLMSNKKITHIKVYNVLGKLLIDKQTNDTEINLKTTANNTPTILLFKVDFNDGTTLNKKFIKYN